ncbi:MAG: amidase family protein [Pseudomonadota bacterium]
MQDWLTMSASALGRAIGAGEIDPVDLAQACLDAATSHPLSARIYARLTPERAMEEANAASKRAKSGRRLSPLDGVPISWKDLVDTAGVVTEAGSALLKDRVPDRDAACLRSATLAGTVCLGKTHLTELAFSGLGLNPVTQSAPNVHDPDLLSGGSSSGAAASVGYGLAPLAIGSDTGGSVRVPSAWNDLVGLKTTLTRVPVEGCVALCKQFDTIGPLARSVEDAALCLSVLEGKPAPDLNGASLAGRRFAILNTVAMEEVEAAPMAAFESAVARLQTAGANVVHIDAPEIAEAMSLSGPLYAGEAYGLWKEQIEANPDVMYPLVLQRFRAGEGFTAPDYVAAWHRLEICRAQWAARTQAFDAVLCPTIPILPPTIRSVTEDDDCFVERNLMALRNTRIGNLMNASVLTLPTGTPHCGISLMAPPMGEHALLRLGIAAEAALA